MKKQLLVELKKGLLAYEAGDVDRALFLIENSGQTQFFELLNQKKLDEAWEKYYERVKEEREAFLSRLISPRQEARQELEKLLMTEEPLIPLIEEAIQEPSTVIEEAAREVLARERVVLFSFYVGDFVFALNAEFMQEVNLLEVPVSSLPVLPKFVLGVANLRGEIVPIIDLAKRLGIEEPDYGDMRYILIKAGERSGAFLLSGVGEIKEYDPSDIRPLPQLLKPFEACDVFDGLIIDNGRIVLLLNIANLLRLW